LLLRHCSSLGKNAKLSRPSDSSRLLRSQQWFDNPENPGMTALYLERYLNFGLTREELQSGRPIIGIAQTGSDLSPCNRVHVSLASRLRDGIRDAGGLPLEFPCHPIQETGRRPTAALDRNLSYIALVEVLHGYPLDGVILTTGCDKTTPALLMAAATADLPAIISSGGPMLDGWWEGRLAGSGSVIWDSRRKLAAGEINYDEFLDRVCSSAPSAGHCNTMGTVRRLIILPPGIMLCPPFYSGGDSVSFQILLPPYPKKPPHPPLPGIAIPWARCADPDPPSPVLSAPCHPAQQFLLFRQTTLLRRGS
jgi:dihydroxy-acid dehydratase